MSGFIPIVPYASRDEYEHMLKDLIREYQAMVVEAVN
jgi:hypothetical protein